MFQCDCRGVGEKWVVEQLRKIANGLLGTVDLIATPEQMEAIAALVFMEMQEAGYAAVGEFHYVHHQPGGDAYADIAELATRIAAAASDDATAREMEFSKNVVRSIDR